MQKLLFIGDAACGSGFARASQGVLRILRDSWDITVIGINYRGDPHPDNKLYPIYPALTGGDALGLGRVRELVPRLKPDLVVVQTNPWHVPRYARQLELAGSTAPVVGIIAVEGKNCRGTDLNKLTRAVFWNRFGQHEAELGGMTVPSGVVPLGVDLDVFKPGNKEAALEALELKGLIRDDAFIVLNVNRNQNRKRLDLSIQYFAEWMHSRKIPNAYLYLHVPPGSMIACDCDQLGGYYGLKGHFILAEPENIFLGVPEPVLVQTYQAADVFLSTSLGEGHGLTAMEAMACGVPPILGDYAAFGEWAKGYAELVPCPLEGVMPDVHNMIGGVPDKDAVVNALDTFYDVPQARAMARLRALECVRQPPYRWENVARGFAEEIEKCSASCVSVS